jgi:hypothetical protein
MKIKTYITTTKEVEVDLEFPAFFKNPSCNQYIAVFDESDILKVWDSEKFSSIDQGTLEADYLKKEVIAAFQTWNVITREEFEIVYHKVMKLFALPVHIPKDESFVDTLKRVL